MSVNDYFKDLPKQEIQEVIDDTRAEAFVFAKYLIETGMELRKKAGLPIDQPLKSLAVFHPHLYILCGLCGNEPQIARQLNLTDITCKACEPDFPLMWRSRLGNSSDNVSRIAEEGDVELPRKDGMLADEMTINKYLSDRGAQWAATIGFEGLGVIVLDTKIYPDIGDIIRARDAIPGYDPSDDETYQGDVDILDRVWDAVVEIPEWAERLHELTDLVSAAPCIHRTAVAEEPQEISRRKSFAGLREEVSSDALTGPLLLISFVCGVLDATIYYNFRIFASNQTGNTLILTIILAGLHPTRSQLGLAAVSLGGFLTGGFIFARLGLRFTNNAHRQKWWLLVSASTQALFVLVPCILLTILKAGKEPLQIEGGWDSIIIGLFAAGSGVQVVMAKSSGTGIPTAMLTSPYADCLLDEHLFAPPLSKQGKDRTVRLGYILALLSGSFFGGLVQKHSGTIAVVWWALALRVVSVVWIAWLKPEEGKIQLEDDEV